MTMTMNPRQSDPGSTRPVQTVPPIIQVTNVSKSFGKEKTVVHDLNFAVAPGQIFCLLGPSGSGKSTTMRLLTGLYRPTEGQVLVFNQEPARFQKKLRERMGYMPQQFVLFPELSVWGNVNFVASVYGMSWFGRRKKIKRVLEFVDLWDSQGKLASQLSGGMQRRLELAATLINNPDLIFVDEPTAGIDPILRAKFWEHFRELRDQGRTIFVTTQYVTEADYCDIVAILNRGRVLSMGAPEDIRREAFGGEIINVTLENVSTQATRLLQSVPGVKTVRYVGSQDLQLTTDNAGVTLPLVTASLQDAGINILSIEPYRPDFEEVFVELMEQDNQEDDTQHVQEKQIFRQTMQKAGVTDPGTTDRRRTQRTEEPRPMPAPNPTAPTPSPDPTMPIEPNPNMPPAPAEPGPIRPPAPILPTGPDSQADLAGFAPPVIPTVGQNNQNN